MTTPLVYLSLGVFLYCMPPWLAATIARLAATGMTLKKRRRPSNPA
ncbi:hypothetical protein [Kushneria avicenniae]|nr:hypothetical protein [Kushneria avicenniae]